MSIMNSKAEYAAALEKAHKEFPLRQAYQNSPDSCVHDYGFVVFCDGGDWDIVRCQKCGSERICACTFDDDYD